MTYIALTPTSPTAHSSGPSSASCTSSAATSIADATGTGVDGNWSTYHGDNSRAGVGPSSAITSASPAWAGSVRLDGQVFAEPLVCGNSLFLATENNSVYALNAATGSVLWRTNLGTPVQGSTLPCGDIDPSGITGTPVIDGATGVLYAVAFLSTDTHELFGLNIQTGNVVSHTVVDAVGADPHVEQQRGALALENGIVYIPYGGLAGDCGDYHGWVVGVNTSGSGGLLSYQVPTGREGGIWATAGISFAANGDLYVATGNSEATTTFDYGDAVIELSPSLQVVSYFAPANWAQLNSGDVDVGSLAPTVLPTGNLFQVGKEGEGYIMSGTQLGGINGQIFESPVCSGAYGGTARVGSSVFVPCTNGIFEVNATTSTFSLGWHTANFDAGSPIVTGNILWAVDISNATLLGFSLSSGEQLFAFPLGGVDHFISPSAAPGIVYVAGGDTVFAFALG
ncbi:MAG TPA: PQQ-binding-like beta-propeller repeat protein [Thermoplasmata archaeon]|nr:PQQ-binding-like beta-propeller repeat protein [Thermoplasmata archaeon]